MVNPLESRRRLLLLLCSIRPNRLRQRLWRGWNLLPGERREPNPRHSLVAQTCPPQWSTQSSSELPPMPPQANRRVRHFNQCPLPPLCHHNSVRQLPVMPLVRRKHDYRQGVSRRYQPTRQGISPQARLQFRLKSLRLSARCGSQNRRLQAILVAHRGARARGPWSKEGRIVSCQGIEP